MGLEFEDIHLSSNNNNLHGWLIKNINSDKLLIFFHGNGGNISNRLSFIKLFDRLNISVLIFDYPGYGKSEGEPSEKNLNLSGKLFTQYAIDYLKYSTDKIILYGESIGCPVASYISTLYDIKYLLLQSGFISISKLVAGYFINETTFLGNIFDKFIHNFFI